MTIEEQQELCKNAFVDVINYFATECPNMLTFYNMFKTSANSTLLTIRINTQDDCYPILEYNPNWIEKCYGTSKFYFIYAIYCEMLKFILHHATKRAAGPHTACASFTITNCRESRSVLNYIEQSQRDATIAFLETMPCRTWLDQRIAPEVCEEKNFVLEKVEAILENLVSNPDDYTRVEAVGDAPFTVPETCGEETIYIGNNSFVLLKSFTHPLDDYYSIRSLYECSARWGDNGIMDEAVTQKFENCGSEGWGNTMTDSLLGKIQLANARKVNVTAILSRIRGKIQSRKSYLTRTRPNRRYEDDLLFPGERHKFKSNILFAYDESGSMDTKDLVKGFSMLDSFFKESKCDYCLWDTNCTKPKPWTGKLSSGDKIDALGGGNTLPESVGQMLERESLHYDAVILFTDTYWSWPIRNIPLGTQLVVISTVDEETLKKLPGFVDFSLTLKSLIGE